MICPDCDQLRHDGPCKWVECPDCQGEGRVCGERVIGGVTAAGPWQSYQSYMQECELCGGWGEIAADPWGEDDEEE